MFIVSGIIRGLIKKELIKMGKEIPTDKLNWFVQLVMTITDKYGTKFLLVILFLLGDGVMIYRQMIDPIIGLSIAAAVVIVYFIFRDKQERRDQETVAMLPNNRVKEPGKEGAN